MGHLIFLISLPIIWLLPGILFRRWQAKKTKAAKTSAQMKAIARLYPKEPERNTND